MMAEGDFGGEKQEPAKQKSLCPKTQPSSANHLGPTHTATPFPVLFHFLSENFVLV